MYFVHPFTFTSQFLHRIKEKLELPKGNLQKLTCPSRKQESTRILEISSKENSFPVSSSYTAQLCLWWTCLRYSP